MNPYTKNPIVDKDRLHAVKLKVQEFFQQNTVLVIGLGPSASLGLPSMGALAKELDLQLAGNLHGDDQNSWSSIKGRLDDGFGLERALQSVKLSDGLYARIVRITSECVRSKEDEAITKLLSSEKMPALSCLLNHISVAGRTLNVVTTNYDRMIEVQAEIAGLGVDVGYPGQYASAYSPRASIRSHQLLDRTGAKPRIFMERHLRLFKPHGSLDWIRSRGSVRRSMVTRIQDPVIIAPGASKYRVGYEEPFSREREGASAALRSAQRYIVIGYGFNDDQLEQSWCPGLLCDKPLLLVTMELSENAESLIRNSGAAVALSMSKEYQNYTQVHLPGEDTVHVNSDLWSLDGFVTEIIKDE